MELDGQLSAVVPLSQAQTKAALHKSRKPLPINQWHRLLRSLLRGYNRG